MAFKFFNAGMAELTAIYDDERLLQVHTTNFMADDSLYFTATTDEIAGEDFESEIRRALRHKYGKMGPGMYLGYEDVTDMYYDEDGYAL